MKYYRSVLQKVEEQNYKNGVNRIDTNSGFYTVFKRLYYIAFVWYAVFQFSYLFANTAAFGSRAASKVVIPLYITFWVVTAMVVAGFFFLRRKWHVAALSVSGVACAAEVVMLGRNDNVSIAFLEGGFLNNKHFWFYYAPGGLIILFMAVLCFIGIKSYLHRRNDYKRVLSGMYYAYKEEHESVSDIEWQQHLEELDAALPKEEKKSRKK